MGDCEELLDALFDVALALGADTMWLGLDRDDHGFSRSGRAEFRADGSVVDLLSMPPDVVRSCTGFLVQLAGVSVGSVAMFFVLRQHSGDAELPHPQDVKQGEVCIRLGPSPVEPPTVVDAKHRVVQQLAAVALPAPVKVGELLVGRDAAERVLLTLFETMLAEDADRAGIYPGVIVEIESAEGKRRVDAQVGFSQLREVVLKVAAMTQSVSWPHEALLSYSHGGAEHSVRVAIGEDDAEDYAWDEQAWIEFRRVRPVVETPRAAPTTDSIGDQLLASVLAEEGNRAAQLVYADWLSEQGDRRGELLVRHGSFGRRAVLTWLGDIASVVEHAELDATLGAAIVVGDSSEAQWRQILTERHWQLVRSLWLAPSISSSRALNILSTAQLPALRQLIVSDDRIVASIGRTSCARSIETLGIVHHGYSPHLAELQTAIGANYFPALRRCTVLMPDSGDRVTETSWESFRRRDREVTVNIVRASMERPLALLPLLGGA